MEHGMAEEEAVEDPDFKAKEDLSSAAASDYSIQIPGWPTCFHNVNWSADSELAIAVNDHVEILIPRVSFEDLKEQLSTASLLAEHPHSDDRRFSTLRNVKSAVEGVASRTALGARSGAGSEVVVDLPGLTEDGRWTRLRVTTNMFKNTEIPTQRPMTFENHSIGEEQSTSHAIGLAWSAPGLAWNGGCVLGFLTSNGALGIWDALHGKRSIAKNWNRVLTINHTMRSWANSLSSDNGVARDSWNLREWNRRRHLRARLRSFAWMPVPEGLRGRQMVVVSNDLGELVFVEIRTPQRKRDAFAAEVRGHLNVFMSMATPMPKTPLDAFVGPPRYAENLACSPILTPNATSSQRVIVAYTIGAQLYLSICLFALPEVGLDIDVLTGVHHIEGLHMGPLKWETKTPQEYLRLYSFNRAEISTCRIGLSNSDPSVTQVSKNHELGWDAVAAWTLTSTENLQFLHCLPHMSYPESTVTSMALQPTETNHRRHWAQLLELRRAGFSAEFGMGDDVVGRIWGMDSAPLSDHIALCMSLHPTKMLQYQMLAFQHCHVMISDENENLPIRSDGSGTTTSTESFLFSFSRWLRRRVQKGPLAAPDLDEVDRFVTDHFGPFGNIQNLREETSLRVLSQRLRLITNGCEWLWTQLMAIMKAIEPNLKIDYPSLHDANMIMRRRYCAAVSNLRPQQFRPTILGGKILALYAASVYCIPQPSTDHHMVVDADPDDKATSREICDVCDEEIKLESLDWAKCRNGHAFGRCNMTFLAIQEPGITRHCGLCERRYLSPSYLVSKDQEMGLSPNQTRSDAAQLFSLVELMTYAFDVCVGCNGRLVG